MNIFRFLITLVSILIVNESSAQVYVFAREDRADIIQNFNTEDGGTKVQKQIEEREGKWFSLLETDIPGHGAIFCVASSVGAHPKYFVSYGKTSPAEAIIEARSKAQDYSKGKSNADVFIMRTFNNQNKYPFKRSAQKP